jgi:hypothetical protein
MSRWFAKTATPPRRVLSSGAAAPPAAARTVIAWIAKGANFRGNFGFLDSSGHKNYSDGSDAPPWKGVGVGERFIDPVKLPLKIAGAKDRFISPYSVEDIDVSRSSSILCTKNGAVYVCGEGFLNGDAYIEDSGGWLKVDFDEPVRKVKVTKSPAVNWEYLDGKAPGDPSMTYFETPNTQRKNYYSYLMITEDGELYGFGLSYCGMLGDGKGKGGSNIPGLFHAVHVKKPNLIDTGVKDAVIVGHAVMILKTSGDLYFIGLDSFHLNDDTDGAIPDNPRAGFVADEQMGMGYPFAALSPVKISNRKWKAIAGHGGVSQELTSYGASEFELYPFAYPMASHMLAVEESTGVIYSWTGYYTRPAHNPIPKLSYEYYLEHRCYADITCTEEEWEVAYWGDFQYNDVAGEEGPKPPVTYPFPLKGPETAEAALYNAWDRVECVPLLDEGSAILSDKHGYFEEVRSPAFYTLTSYTVLCFPKFDSLWEERTDSEGEKYYVFLGEGVIGLEPDGDFAAYTGPPDHVPEPIGAHFLQSVEYLWRVSDHKYCAPAENPYRNLGVYLGAKDIAISADIDARHFRGDHDYDVTDANSEAVFRNGFCYLRHFAFAREAPLLACLDDESGQLVCWGNTNQTPESFAGFEVQPSVFPQTASTSFAKIKAGARTLMAFTEDLKEEPTNEE